MSELAQQRLQDLRGILQEADAATLAIRDGLPRSHQGEHSEALYLTSSYVFNSAAEAASRFSGELLGNVYSRYTNPTVQQFETRVAALEGAEAACATSSGMAAILAIGLAFLKAGDHVICSRSVFGSTTSLFDKYFIKFGVQLSYVDLADLGQWQQAIRPNTRLFFCESPSNPLAEIGDMKAIGQLAQQAGARFVVDNCFCTPILQQPLKFGADLVMHSATKFMDGQGRCLGGVVAGSAADIAEIVGVVRTAGPTLSPFNAWVLLKGLETLRLRMLAHCQSAMQLALWLQQQPQVTRVYYAGLPSHPGHALAAKQQPLGFGAVLAFEVQGGREQAWSVIDHTRLLSITANLGDTKTTITHPATTSHGRLSEEQRQQAGISQNLIRISVGLEDLVDLKADLARALGSLS